MTVVQACLACLFVWMSGQLVLPARTCAAQGDHRRAVVVLHLPPVRHRWCLLIGIDRYEQGEGLRCACSDAHRIGKALIETGGCLASQAVLMTTEEQTPQDLQPTKANIIRAVGEIARHAGSSGDIVFYYAGHGKSIQGESFLVPTDAIKPDGTISRDALISVRWLRAELRRRCPVGNRLLLLDSCDSGGTRALSPTSTAPAVETDGGHTVTITACGVDESSYEIPELPAGAFSYLLDQALRGAADYRHDGIVTSTDAYHYVSSQIAPLLAQHGEGDQPQTPQIIPANAVAVVLTHPHREAAAPALSGPQVLEREKPLAPVLLLNVEMTRYPSDGSQRPDEIAAPALWQNRLLRYGFLLTGANSGIQDYSLTIMGESHSAIQVSGIYTVSVLPLTALLRDRRGTILASEQIGGDQFTTRAGIQETDAYQKALEAASDALFAKMDDRLKALVPDR